MSVSTADTGTPTAAATDTRRVSTTLVVGAVMWLLLLVVGFFAPGGWTFGMAGPIGHIENYMIMLWLVTLVIAPLLAARQPLHHTGTIQVYLLGIVGMVLSTIRGGGLVLIADGPALVVSALTLGLVIWAHPRRTLLGKLS